MARDGRRFEANVVPVGQFDKQEVETELGFLRQVGFNNIRLIGSFFAWIINNTEYQRNLAFVAETCARLGITITYNLWSATRGKSQLQNDAWNRVLMLFSRPGPNQSDNKPFGEALAAASALTNNGAMALAVPPRGSIWFADAYPEPGSAVLNVSGHPALWPSRGAPGVGADLVDRYLRTVGSVLGRSPAFQSYDLFNEFDVYMLLHPRLARNAAAFVKYSYDQLMRVHPGAACTIGLGDINSLPRLRRLIPEVPQSYYSWHAYFENRDVLGARRVFLQAVRLARGRPVVLSEFHTPAFVETIGSIWKLYLDQLLRFNMGGQMWSYLQTNSFRPHVGEVPLPVARPIDGLSCPWIHTCHWLTIRLRPGSPRSSSKRLRGP